MTLPPSFSKHRYDLRPNKDTYLPERQRPRQVRAQNPKVPLEESPPLLRWEEAQEILIYCEPLKGKVPKGFEKACQAWEALRNIQFKRLDAQPNTPIGIVITWSDDTNPQRPYEVGRTLNQTHQKNGQAYLKRSDIILQRHPKINQHLDASGQIRQQYATFLHEIGHALGLEHTQNPHSVMFHKSLQNTQITPEDLAQLKRLYP
ncbi:MAG: matrixin family metalloprotease [Vampirovibrio sp.]